MSETAPRLLIVEDDDNYRTTLARAMTRRAFDVRTAATPAEALSEGGDFEPEYVILDLNLSGQSGLNLIAPLLERSPGARIVVLTGYASIQTTVAAMRLGACHYLPKPANITDIVQALTEDRIAIDPEVGSDQLSVRHLEWEYIQRKLAEHHGNISATAKALKMHRRTLQRKLAKKRPPAQDNFTE